MEKPINKKQITLVLESGTYTISKLPLRKYSELLSSLDLLPKQFERLTQLQDKDTLVTIPKMIAECLPDIVKIISIATDIPAEKIDEFDLEEVVKVMQAIIEVNQYAEVWESLKKMLAQTNKTK